MFLSIFQKKKNRSDFFINHINMKVILYKNH